MYRKDWVLCGEDWVLCGRTGSSVEMTRPCVGTGSCVERTGTCDEMPGSMCEPIMGLKPDIMRIVLTVFNVGIKSKRQ